MAAIKELVALSADKDDYSPPEASGDDNSSSEDSNSDPWGIPDEAEYLIPDSWTKQPNKKSKKGKEGFRWDDPENQGNGIGIDKGDPNNSQSTQQVDHVIVRYNGKVIGRDGQPIKGRIKNDFENAHIPLNQWQNWRNWHSP